METASDGSPAFWIPGQKKVPSGEGDWDWKIEGDTGAQPVE